MALVVTTVSPNVRTTPFTGISEVARERSGIARAEVVYSSVGTWPATGSGDNRVLSFNYSLNPNFGYVLMDGNAAFIKYGAQNTMEALGLMEITTDLGPGASEKESQWYSWENLGARQDASGATAIGSIEARDYNSMYPLTGGNSGMVFAIQNKPTALLYPFPGVNTIDVTLMFGETLHAQAAMAYRFYMRFLEYDIVQGYNYVIQSPGLTR